MSAESTGVARIGYYSAIFAAIFALAYVVGQLAEWLGLLGSGGGPNSPSTPLGLFVLLTPSLLLAPAFVVLMVCPNRIAPEDKKIPS